MVAELSRSFAHQTALSKILLSFMKKKTHCNHNNGFFYIHSKCIWSKLLKTVTVLISAMHDVLTLFFTEHVSNINITGYLIVVIVMIVSGSVLI